MNKITFQGYLQTGCINVISQFYPLASVAPNRIEKIKGLIDACVKVYDKNDYYECFKTKHDSYAVRYKPNGWTIGAFWKDDTGMNLAAPFYYKDGKRVYL